MELVAVAIASRRVFVIEAVIAAVIVVLLIATLLLSRRRRRDEPLPRAAPLTTLDDVSAGQRGELSTADGTPAGGTPAGWTPAGGTPAGWLPDPGGAPDTLRYWDGSAWTEHFATRA